MQDRNFTTCTLEPSPRQLPRQIHKHLQTITVAIVKTKTLPEAPSNHHRSNCQDKNLTQAPADLQRRLPRQKPYNKHLRTITVAFAKTKTLPQASAKPSPQHLPRQKPYHKHLRAITAAFANKRACEPAPWHMLQQERCHKHLRAFTAAFANTLT